MVVRLTMLAIVVCCVSAMLFGAPGNTDRTKELPLPTMHPDTSAPDAWGYTWVRSTDPGGPTFRWIDITTRGTLVSGLGDDNYVGPFQMNFSLPYYWYNVNRFYVGSNGFICFSSPANFASPFAALPNTGATVPKDLLAICTGDLDFTVAASNPRCYYWTNGTDSLVVSFINVTEWQQVTNPNLKHTFQVVINKSDSTIVYQYGEQQGQYNSTNNTYLSIGWQNQTGQIGLSYTYSTTPPHALMPTNGLAIRIKKTVNTGLQVTDAGIVGGFDALNQASVMRTGVADTIRAYVKNFGNTTITNVPVRYAITGAVSQNDTVVIPTMAPGDQVLVKFPRLFNPTTEGTYTALFNVTVAGDVGPGNNSRTAELVGRTFRIGQNSIIRYENGTVSGSTSWLGGGGFGVSIDLPQQVFPVRVESVYVRTATITTQPMTVEIYDGSSGAPGALLATRSVTATANALNGIDFRSDSVRITGGRFFVGARGDMQFSYETTAPIALRTWEYTNGWAPYRSQDAQDIIIRASVRPEAHPVYSWAAQTSGVTTYLYSVKAASPTVAWAAGAGGVVRRTTDGGTTWTSVGGGAIGTADIYNIEALDANTAFVTTSPAATYIYRTTNGGTNWTQVYTDATTGAFIDAIKMYNATNGIAMGDPVGTPAKWVILKTTDGGATWARIATEPLAIGTETSSQNGMSTIGTTHIWFCSGQGGRVYKSTDAGATWTTGIAPFTATSNVWFNSTLNGIVTSSGSNAVARTNDGGATWSSVTVSGSGFLIACGGFGLADFFYARGTTIYRSPDFGVTWGTSYTGTGTYVALSFVKQGQVAAGWAVTSTGGVAKFSTTLVGVGEPGTLELPESFSLKQNYPNPFNPTTKIQYALPTAAHVTMSVYNILGQEVVQLRDEMQPAGTHEVVWSGVNRFGQSVASGVYLYKIEAAPIDGSTTFRSFKKMLLLK